ncbi:type II secretion system minor pseudopilin GspK [Pantoea dispersa]|uniref:type II secretion system minor pseudopilin GspK n=1 Tax=Pantoea dispersa TaxID=59814 RepID=UPI0039B63B51
MRTQRGVALLTVLMMIAMMTAIAVVAQRQWVDALRRADALSFQQQAKWTLSGAEQWLLAQPQAWQTDRQHTLTLEGETVHYRWHDHQACFNLNALALSGRVDRDNVYWPTAAQRVFIALLTQQGISPENASAAIHTLARALNPDNRRDVPPALEEINQLRALSLFTPAQWSALAPQLCVLPDTRLQINLNGLNTTTLPLLNALLGGQADTTTLATLLTRRPPAGWRDVTAFLADVPDATTAVAGTLQSVAVFSSQEWALQLWISREYHLAAQRTRFVINQGVPQVRYRHYGLSTE